MIYIRLPAGETCYPICMFPTNSESLIGISDAFSVFWLRVSVIFPMCSLYSQQKRAYSALHSLLLKCCFTSTETVGLLKTGAQDGRLDFHTAPEICCATLAGRYIRVYARRHLPSAVPWISEDRLFEKPSKHNQMLFYT